MVQIEKKNYITQKCKTKVLAIFFIFSIFFSSPFDSCKIKQKEDNWKEVSWLVLLSDYTLKCSVLIHHWVIKNRGPKCSICSYFRIASNQHHRQLGQITLGSRKEVPRWINIPTDLWLHKKEEKDNLAACSRKGPQASTLLIACCVCVKDTRGRGLVQKRGRAAAAHQLVPYPHLHPH